MLKTPSNIRATSDNSILAMLSDVRGSTTKDTPLGDGFMSISHFSGDMLVWGRNAPEFYMGHPNLDNIAPGLLSSGVCDTPEQFIERFQAALAADPTRTFFVTFTHVTKDPTNAGNGGGWRWHKWGEYIGDGVPEYEYLDDEAGFDAGIYVYRVLQIDGPEVVA